MKWLVGVLIVLLLLLQYRLWVGEGSLAHVARLEREIQKQQAENWSLQERNRILAAEVDTLKSGVEGLEERARSDMGMIKEGETYYMVLDNE